MKWEKYIKKFNDEYDEEKSHHKKQILRIKKEIDRNVINNLYKEMTIEHFLEKIVLNFNKDNNDHVMRNKIMSHGRRVYNNAKVIIGDLEMNHGIALCEEDKRYLFYSCIFHDIGKLYSSSNHALYSTFMMEYILTTLKIVDGDKLYKVLEPILFHSNKTKRKNKISLNAKILRDSDLFDENCGESLFRLLLTNIKNKQSDFNTIDFHRSTLLLKNKINHSHKTKIIEKINIETNITLYNNLLYSAMEQYYEFIQPFEDEQDDIIGYGYNHTSHYLEF